MELSWFPAVPFLFSFSLRFNMLHGRPCLSNESAPIYLSSGNVSAPVNSFDQNKRKRANSPTAASPEDSTSKYFLLVPPPPHSLHRLSIPSRSFS